MAVSQEGQHDARMSSPWLVPGEDDELGVGDLCALCAQQQTQRQQGAGKEGEAGLLENHLSNVTGGWGDVKGEASRG
jgi:hypothetical protein